MKLIEKGCQLPDNISFDLNKKTKQLLSDIEKLELYFYVSNRTITGKITKLFDTVFLKEKLLSDKFLMILN